VKSNKRVIVKILEFLDFKAYVLRYVLAFKLERKLEDKKHQECVEVMCEIIHSSEATSSLWHPCFLDSLRTQI
jgi:hypothetical protein